MKANKPAAGSRVILYARGLKKEQAGEVQITEMREYAAQQEWKLVGEFIDEGVSGNKQDRPQLDAALEMIKNKECDGLLVHELSRLSRSADHLLDMSELVGGYSVSLVSVRNPEANFAIPS